MMNKFQARKFYRKMFANYPDVLTVEDATNLLGFKSQTGVIRRIHQNRIRYLDLPQLRRMAYLLQMCSNNLNQYAKVANENGRVYAADLEDLRQRLDELIDIGRQILSRLAEL